MFTIYTIILGIPFILWLGMLVFTQSRDTVGTDLITRFKDMTAWQKGVPLAILLFVISFYVLASQGYHYTFLQTTGSVVPAALLVVAICLLVHGMKLGRAMMVSTILLSFPAMLATLFSVAIMEYEHDTLTSPDQRTEIVIEHRNFTLGETNHFYTFYKKVPFLPIMKDMEQNVHVMTRGLEKDDFHVLGADDPEWFDGHVIFKAITGEKFVIEWEKQQALLLGGHVEQISCF